LIIKNRGLFEALTWLSALVALAFSTLNGSHFSFCPFRFLTDLPCPGCGIGHAISYAFHGKFAASFTAHPLGIPAIFILSYRIFSLTKKFFTKTIQHAV